MIVHTSAFNFADVVDRYLRDYHSECVTAMTEAIDEVSKESVKRLRKTSPGSDYPRKWARKKENGRLKAGATVYSKIPGLPHLLEKSHAKRGGGRTNPIVHIAPVEQWAVDEAVDRIIQKMEAI